MTDARCDFPRDADGKPTSDGCVVHGDTPAGVRCSMTTKVVYVVEVELPEEFTLSAAQAAARAVMEAVTTKTNLPCRAWVTIADTADAVLACV